MPVGTIKTSFDNRPRGQQSFGVILDTETDSLRCWDQKSWPHLIEGATIEYEIKLVENKRDESKPYRNLINVKPVSAPPSNGSKPSPAAGGTDRDTLIVDQVLFKGAIDLQTACIRTDLDAETVFHDPATAAKAAIETWERVRARHHRPEDIKKVVEEYGGVVVDVEVVPDRASDMPAPDEDYQDDLG